VLTLIVGFRVLAIPLLPLDKNSLLYGSPDGGITIRADASVGVDLAKAAKSFHIAAHIVSGVVMYTAGDIEVHRGMYGVCYMIDLARAFPPEHFVELRKVNEFPSDHSSQFFRMLRPELLLHLKDVKITEVQNCEPVMQEIAKSNPSLISEGTLPTLSPDNLSMWGKHDHELHESSLRIATCYLFYKRIDDLIAELQHNDSILQQERISYVLHSFGINIRHLGIIGFKCFEKNVLEDYQKRIAMQILSRTLKNILRDFLRKRHLQSIEPVLLEKTACLFAKSYLKHQGKDMSSFIQEAHLEVEIRKRFGYVSVLFLSSFSHWPPNIPMLMLKVFDKCGIRLRENTRKSLVGQENVVKLHELEVIGFNSKSKRLSFIEVLYASQLVVSANRALKKNGFSQNHQMFRLRSLASSMLFRSLESQPDNEKARKILDQQILLLFPYIHDSETKLKNKGWFVRSEIDTGFLRYSFKLALEVRKKEGFNPSTAMIDAIACILERKKQSFPFWAVCIRALQSQYPSMHFQMDDLSQIDCSPIEYLLSCLACLAFLEKSSDIMWKTSFYEKVESRFKDDDSPVVRLLVHCIVKYECWRATPKEISENESFVSAVLDVLQRKEFYEKLLSQTELQDILLYFPGERTTYTILLRLFFQNDFFAVLQYKYSKYARAGRTKPVEMYAPILFRIRCLLTLYQEFDKILSKSSSSRCCPRSTACIVHNQ
jgi:hypothetical protein